MIWFGEHFGSKWLLRMNHSQWIELSCICGFLLVADPGIDGMSVWRMLSEGDTPPRTEFLYNIDDIYKNAALR